MAVRLIGALGAIAALAAAAGGCAARETAGTGERTMAGHFRAVAVLHTASGAPAGRAVAEQVPGGLKVTIEAEGLPAGPHGAHVHTVGKCDAPDFTSAGGHWNPTAHQHGSMNPAGPHMGDMPNLVVGADGRGTIEFTLAGATYEGLLDEDGAAMMIHAGADDLKTDPSGNSGARIACGVFEAQ